MPTKQTNYGRSMRTQQSNYGLGMNVLQPNYAQDTNATQPLSYGQGNINAPKSSDYCQGMNTGPNGNFSQGYTSVATRQFGGSTMVPPDSNSVSAFTSPWQSGLNSGQNTNNSGAQSPAMPVRLELDGNLQRVETELLPSCPGLSSANANFMDSDYQNTNHMSDSDMNYHRMSYMNDVNNIYQDQGYQNAGIQGWQSLFPEPAATNTMKPPQTRPLSGNNPYGYSGTMAPQPYGTYGTGTYQAPIDLDGNGSRSTSGSRTAYSQPTSPLTNAQDPIATLNPFANPQPQPSEPMNLKKYLNERRRLDDGAFLAATDLSRKNLPPAAQIPQESRRSAAAVDNAHSSRFAAELARVASGQGQSISTGSVQGNAHSLRLAAQLAIAASVKSIGTPVQKTSANGDGSDDGHILIKEEPVDEAPNSSGNNGMRATVGNTQDGPDSLGDMHDGPWEYPEAFRNRSAEDQKTELMYNRGVRCAYDSRCRTYAPWRQCGIRNYLGRQKLALRAIPEEIWIHICRKHYQKVRFRNTSSWAQAKTTCVDLDNQLQKFEEWSNDNLTKNNGPVIRHWNVFIQKSGLERRRKVKNGELLRLNEPQNTVPAWLDPLMGQNLNWTQLWAVFRRINATIENRGDVAFPAVEFVPHITNHLGNGPEKKKYNSLKKTLKREREDDGVIQPQRVKRFFDDSNLDVDIKIENRQIPENPV